MAVGSVEWQRPIRRDGVETQLRERRCSSTRGAVGDQPRRACARPSASGTGVRWKSPLGPLQADLAYGFKRKQLRLHFNIGATF